ncbi:MAG: rod shape-determining protein RodA [Bradymonadia bacterium]
MAVSRQQSAIGRIDWALLGMVALLASIGVINLQSTSAAANSQIYMKQVYFLLIGTGVMAVVAAINYRSLQRYAPIFYTCVVVLLALVLVVGKEVNGSRRWFDFGGTSFQPSELAKLAVILMLATWFNKVRRPGGYSLRDLVPAAALLGMPMFLILQEPDLGHTLMIMFIGMSMLAFERFDRRALMSLIGAGIAAMPLMWMFVLRDYQKDRILTLLDGKTDTLGSGWHAFQARVAVGSGQFFGKGHGQGTQVSGGFLPENHTDFVFANFAEEQGFIGAAGVLLLYMAIILWALRIAVQAREKFGGHVAVGVAALLFWQVFMNVGMVLNILPVTGVTLPLMSYGGSSVLTVMAAFGLLLNIRLRRTIF